MESRPHKHKNLRFALRVLWLLTKGFAALFAVLAVLAGGFVYFSPRILDAERVRKGLLFRLEERLGRPVLIQRLILTPQGLKLHNLKILGAGPEEPPLLESDHALLTIRLAPLLARRVEIKNARLSSPRIRLSRPSGGEWNFADILRRAAAGQGAPPAGLLTPVALAAERFTIEDGRLEVADEARGARAAIERFTLSVENFSLKDAFAYALSFDNESTVSSRTVTASLSASGEASLAGLDPAGFFVRASELELKVDGRVVRGLGQLVGLAPPLLEAELLAPALEDGVWRAYLGRPLPVVFPPGRWKARVRFEGPKLLAVESLSVTAGPLVAEATGQLDLRGELARVEAQVWLSSFPLSSAPAFYPKAERWALKGSAWGRAVLSGDRERLSLHEASLSVRGLGAKFQLGAVTGGDADLEATRDFNYVALRVRRGAGESFSNTVTDLSLWARLSRRDLSVEGASLSWNGERLRARARVVDISNPKEVSVSAALDKLHWEKTQQLVGGFLAAFSTGTTRAQAARAQGKPWVKIFKYAIPRRFPDTIGRLRIAAVEHKNFSFANTDLLWDIRGIDPSLKKAAGDLWIGFGPGRVSDIEAVQDSHKFLRIIFLPYVYMHKMNKLSALSAATAYPKTLDFSRIEGEYGVAQGVVTTRFFSVDSPQLKAYADGTADFGRERVDMGILTRLTSYNYPLPEWWVDESGRPAIAFRVKGDLGNPDLEPRLNKMASDEIEVAVEEGRKRAKARFGAAQKLENLLEEGKKDEAKTEGAR